MNSTLFLTGFGAYVLFLIWLGWFVSRNQKSGEDFLLGGRGLPLFLVLGTTVATMVGTGSNMGAVGFGYSNGWAGALYGIGGAIGILLLALWFAPVRKLNFMTMSEELAYYVGSKPHREERGWSAYLYRFYWLVGRTHPWWWYVPRVDCRY